MSSGASDLDLLPGDLVTDLRQVELLALDVDGVLTDGHVHFDDEGRETKVFHVHDISGLVYWKRAGFASALISGRDSPAVRARAREMCIDEVRLGQLDKAAMLQDVLGARSIDPSRVCYVGDDLLDLPAMHLVGVPISVPEGRREVQAASRYVTRARAGAGAVREVVELLLAAKGLFGEMASDLALPGGEQ